MQLDVQMSFRAKNERETSMQTAKLGISRRFASRNDMAA